MRIISLSICVVLGLGAADTAPDPVFTAKVEQAMRVIRAKQADAANAEFTALCERLGTSGISLPKSDGRAMVLDLSAVQVRQIRLGNSRGMSLGFADPAAAEAAAARLDVDAIIAGSWMFYDFGNLSELTELAGAMGGRIYSANTHSLGPDVPAPDAGTVRRKGDESAVMSVLKSGIFPAQVQFQGGAYLDQDQDNVGEYGLIGHLSGQTPTARIGAGQLKLLTGPLAKGDQTANYTFKTWLPGADATSAVSTWEELQALKTPDANLREQRWTVYAWPTAGSTGMVYAIAEDGQVRRQPWDGTEPSWNAVRGGKAWTDILVWPIATR